MNLEDFLQLSKEALIKQDIEKKKYLYKISQLNQNGSQIKVCLYTIIKELFTIKTYIHNKGYMENQVS